jgi:hypothetical protein
MNSDIKPDMPPKYIGVRQEDLLSLLDAEIGHIYSVQQRAGWNLWALLLALTASLWMLLDIAAGSKQIAWRQSVQVLVGLSALIDLVLAIYYATTLSNKRRAHRARYQLGYWLSEKRLALLFATMKSLVFVGLIARVSLGIHIVFVIVLILFYVMIALFSGLVLYNTYRSIPLEAEPQTYPIGSAIFVLFLVSILTWPIVCYLKQGAYESGIINYGSLQAGGLLVACLYTIQVASQIVGASPLLDNLVKLRRELVLQHSSPQDIAHRIDIALSGLGIEDIAQEKLSFILSLLQELHDKQKEAGEWLDITRSNLKSMNTMIDIKSPEKEVAKLLKEAESNIEDFESEFDEIGPIHNKIAREFNRFSVDVYGLGTHSETIKQNTPLMLSRIEAAMDLADKATKTLLDEANGVKEIIAANTKTLEDKS